MAVMTLTVWDDMTSSVMGP